MFFSHFFEKIEDQQLFDPMQQAIAQNNLQKLQSLINEASKTVDVGVLVDSKYQNLLHVASSVEFNSLPIVEHLLKLGKFNVNAVDKYNCTGNKLF